MTTTLPPTATVPAPAAPAYSVSLAVTGADVREAQRLRHDVFAGELGARLPDREVGLDIDEFDSYCDHLLVRDETTGQAVGTYRLLPPERAHVAGRLYADGEFTLGALDALRPDLVEAGRSCVHPAHRGGAVIALMWAGIAAYMEERGHTWLAGCASVPLDDGGARAAGVWRVATAGHLAPPEYRVTPRQPWTAPEGVAPAPRSALPPLVRGYLRLGAWVCGPPAHDPAFGTADFYVLLSLRDADPRYMNHFRSLARL